MFQAASNFIQDSKVSMMKASIAVLALLAGNSFALELEQRVPSQAVVLSYHDVKEQGTKLAQEDVDVERLEDQFEYMKAKGYSVIPLARLIAHKTRGEALPDNSVVLTFDDGYVSFYTKVFPLLKKYSYPATLALVTRWMEMNPGEKINYNGFEVRREDFITWEQANEMKQSGLVEIASHTHDLHHGVKANPRGSLIPAAITQVFDGLQFESKAEYAARVHKDLETSRRIIEKRTGNSPASIVWPYGQFNEKSREVAKSIGFESALTLRDYADTDEFDAWTVPRKMLVGNPELSSFRDYLEKSNEYLPSVVKRISNMDAFVTDDPNEIGLSRLIDESVRSGWNGVILQPKLGSNWLFKTKVGLHTNWLQRASWRLAKGMGVEVAVDVGDILQSPRKDELLRDLASQTSLWGVYAHQATEQDVADMMTIFPMSYILLQEPQGKQLDSHRVWSVKTKGCHSKQCYGLVRPDEQLKWLKASSPYVMLSD